MENELEACSTCSDVSGITHLIKAREIGRFFSGPLLPLPESRKTAGVGFVRAASLNDGKTITFIDPFCGIYRNQLYCNYDLLAVKRLFAKMESDY